MGICVGLQALFDGSSEDASCPGLAVVPQHLGRFNDADKAVPHIGWNDAFVTSSSSLYDLRPASKYYYVHSFRCAYEPGLLESQGWTVATAQYGDETFVGAVARGNILATQFHPEKSGVAGLRVLRAFCTGEGAAALGKPLAPGGPPPPPTASLETQPTTTTTTTPAAAAAATAAATTTTTTTTTTAATPQKGLTRRVIACLDVRTNDAGDLVVTKGDQYDVREKSSTANEVRNLGKPVDMARSYYHQGADEVTFLNITSFRDLPLQDLPMLEILRQTSQSVFVPLTIGGGIRDTVDPATGARVSALDIATMYFRSGADKVSIGSDAVLAAEAYWAAGAKLSGTTAIEQISAAYGNQAVVVSVDPKRVYVDDAAAQGASPHSIIPTAFPGPNGETHVWYACTIKGGRETRDLDVVQLARAVQAMGCGELLLNCIDRDGTNSGFDLELIRQVKRAVTIPVIASSGAGVPAHFEEVFQQTTTDAALGAGMFHRGEYTVQQVKEYLGSKGLAVRGFEGDL
ncbi:imidazole glycerol phosphate synthase hisHF [Coniella lustricola]|uniref:Imidazole glycerol phosphate synthase hisHF n=1 Tax=Coniella lustricola TaxID=2025994 RepID=A0A2T2ZT88_9PEZI|nr:imidazole glycerol phosphate synthase hisHF [Coniella lustricola]